MIPDKATRMNSQCYVETHKFRPQPRFVSLNIVFRPNILPQYTLRGSCFTSNAQKQTRIQEYKHRMHVLFPSMCLAGVQKLFDQFTSRRPISYLMSLLYSQPRLKQNTENMLCSCCEFRLFETVPNTSELPRPPALTDGQRILFLHYFLNIYYNIFISILICVYLYFYFNICISILTFVFLF